MPTFVLKDAEVLVNSVDLSDHVGSVRLTYIGELQDVSAMGVTNRVRVAGVTDWSIEINFQQDFDAAEVDATIFPLVGAAAFPITIMADKTAGVSATNPRFEGNTVLETYPILDGAFGDVMTVPVTFQAAGNLTRAVA